MNMKRELNIGDTSDNGQITILDEDRLCYLVKSESKGAFGIRTISKTLLEEYVAYFSKHPNATADDARDELKGNSNIDKFEYGYSSTLRVMAQMVLGQINTTVSAVEFLPKAPSVLHYPLQQIFYGAPGTGKSHTINEITEQQPKENVFRTTFHPDSDYSTFVGCYKPTKERNNTQSQSILDYDSLVDKFKGYLGVKDPYQNITRACTLFGYDYHDSIVHMQDGNTHTIPELVTDAYKSGTTYDSQVRAGMACYEEAVKPQISSSKITYSFVPQSFTKAYLRAWQTEGPVYLVIEEINRGNCAQIFGDLFQLLDRKDGVSEYPIKADNDLAVYIGEELAKKSRENIPENVKSGEELVLPSNLYIWATMNTSDQSLFPIDSAFKRRWDWTYIPIDTTKESWNINADGVNYDWSDFLEKINAKIESATSSEDKMLGFYFCKAENDVITAERFVNKVVFYLWNDVFKDYGFDDAVFNDENNKKITFRMFYKADGKVNEGMVAKFLDNLEVKSTEQTVNSETNIDDESLTETERHRKEYWKKFLDYATKNADYSKYFSGRKTPSTNKWYNFSIGEKDCYLTVNQTRTRNELSVGLYFENTIDNYNKLKGHKDEIERELNITFEWRDMDDSKASYIVEVKNNVKFENPTEEELKEQFEYIIDRLLRMRETFKKYLAENE